jgi:hypothetical protein
LYTNEIVISHSLNMRMRQAGVSRMLHCLAADACEFICELSARGPRVAFFSFLSFFQPPCRESKHLRASQKKIRSHSKNPVRSARFLVTARRRLCRAFARRPPEYPALRPEICAEFAPQRIFHPKFGPSVDHWYQALVSCLPSFSPFAVCRI